MINLTIFLFSSSFFIVLGYFLNKYGPCLIIFYLYYFLNKINIKYILAINILLNFILLIQNFNFGNLNIYDINLNMSSNDSNLPNTNTISNTNTIKDNTVFVKNPYIPINVSNSVAEKLVNGISLAAGAKIGLEIAKNNPNIGVKAAAAVFGGLALTQAKETVTKYYQNTSNNVDNSSKFISNFNNLLNKNKLDFTEYPLNLIEDLIVYNYISIFFLFIILNSFLSILLKDININKYLPAESNKNSIIFFRFIYFRIINIWYNSAKYLIIFSCFFLLFCLLMSKFCLYCITS